MRYVFFVFIFAFFLSGAVAGGYYYYYLIPEKVERKLLESIHALGFEAFSFDSVVKDGEKITIRNVILDKDGFSKIDEISIHFSLSQILFKSDQARSIHIKGMKLTGSYDARQNGITFDGFGAQSDFLDNIKQLPARTIIVEDGRADIMSDDLGGLQVDYTLQLNRQNDDGFNLIGRVASKQNKLSFHSKVTGTVTSAAHHNFTAEIEQLSLTHSSIKIRRGAATARYNSNLPSEYKADLHLASLVWNDFPLSNVKGAVTYTPAGYSTNLSGSTFGAAGIPWEASVDIVDGDYVSIVTMKPDTLGTAFDFFTESKEIGSDKSLPDTIAKLTNPSISINTKYTDHLEEGMLNVELDHLSSALVARFTADAKTGDIRGRFDKQTIEVKNLTTGVSLPFLFDGAFTISDFWGDADLDFNLLARISNGSLIISSLKILNIEGLVPFGSKTKDTKIDLLKFSLPLKKSVIHTGTLASSIHGENGFEILRGGLSIYGGSVKADKPIYSRNDIISTNTLTVTDINIAQLFADAGFENIFISGKLGGVVPLRIEDKTIKANGGILQSQSSGIIKLPDAVSLSLFPGESDRMQTIRIALTNFHYEFFEIRFDGDLSGRVLMTLSARGLNPDFKDKTPVDLNLQIETKIATLFKNLMR